MSWLRFPPVISGNVRLSAHYCSDYVRMRPGKERERKDFSRFDDTNLFAYDNSQRRINDITFFN